MRNFLKGLLGSRASDGSQISFPPPETGQAGPVYAIGDVHGRSDLLIGILQQIEDDAAVSGGHPLVVFLGDYIDRGDDSREVLDCLMLVEAEGRCDLVFLAGNHEQMLLDFLDRPTEMRHWLRYGGLATMMSYGIRGTGVGEASDDEGLLKLRDRLEAAIDPDHVELLRRMPVWHRSGNLLFVHAGADPEREPGAQDEKTLLWGCRSFGRVPRRDGIWVVHGHTIVDEPRADQGIVSVDTGAYVTGRLTAARIQDGEIRFLST